MTNKQKVSRAVVRMLQSPDGLRKLASLLEPVLMPKHMRMSEMDRAKFVKTSAGRDMLNTLEVRGAR